MHYCTYCTTVQYVCFSLLQSELWKKIFYFVLYTLCLFMLLFEIVLAIHCSVILHCTGIKFCSRKELSLLSAARYKIDCRTKLTTLLVPKAKNQPIFDWHFLCTDQNSKLILLKTKERFKISKNCQQIWVQHLLGSYLQKIQEKKYYTNSLC